MMASHGYSLRTTRRNYQELAIVKLPKAFKPSSQDELYPIEVVETDGSRQQSTMLDTIIVMMNGVTFQNL